MYLQLLLVMPVHQRPVIMMGRANRDKMTRTPVIVWETTQGRTVNVSHLKLSNTEVYLELVAAQSLFYPNPSCTHRKASVTVAKTTNSENQVVLHSHSSPVVGCFFCRPTLANPVGIGLGV